MYVHLYKLVSLYCLYYIIFLNSHSIYVSRAQCSDAVCEALEADLLPFLRTQARLFGEQATILLQLPILRASCSNKNVDCDKLEELQNEYDRISEELKEVGGEINVLLPYFTLCIKG